MNVATCYLVLGTSNLHLVQSLNIIMLLLFLVHLSNCVSPVQLLPGSLPYNFYRCLARKRIKQPMKTEALL